MKFKVGEVNVELIDDGDRICGSIREGRGAFEPDTLQRWSKMCAAGGTVLDIGCYSGLFAIAAAKYGCVVQAFEPMPANVVRIEQNLERNHVMIKLWGGVAITDRSGPIEITYNPKVPFTSGASLIRKKGLKLPVIGMTVDELELEEVSAIKIDVERAEPAVLRGARETLSRCRPALLVEALGSEEIAAVMKELPDYRRAGMLDGRNLLLRPV